VEGNLRKFIYFICLNLLWAVYTWAPTPSDVAMGMVASFIVIMFFGQGQGGDVRKLLSPGSIYHLFIFIFRTIGLFIAAGFAAAAKIVNFMDHPAGDVVGVKLKIKNESAKAILACSVSLFPNMVYIDTQEQNMYIYCLEGAEKKVKGMVWPAEDVIGRIYER
jgi:multisubunit Na+/H+ antiporter MnhE subunit